VYLTKGHEWRYEREHRMTLPLSLHQPLDETAAEPVHLLHYPSEALSRVILGARASEATEDRILNSLRTDSALAHVSFARAELDNESGAIQVFPVSEVKFDVH